MTATQATRAHETELTLPASPADVWKALTDASELKRWFSQDAEAEPGPDGFIRLIWGEMVSTCPIETWQPEQHLRIGWSEGAGEDGKPMPLVVDFHLASADGGTRLRVVHSGFGQGGAWDKQYDGTQRGWGQELACLRHYLAEHRGSDRHLHLVHVPTKQTPAAAWKKLTSTQGLWKNGYSPSLAPGEACDLTAATGDRLQGQVVYHQPPVAFTATLSDENRMFFRVALEDCFGENEVLVWVATWGKARESGKAMANRFEKALAKLFQG